MSLYFKKSTSISSFMQRGIKHKNKPSFEILIYHVIIDSIPELKLI